MEKYRYTYFYIKDNKPEMKTRFEHSNNIKDVKLPCKSVYYITVEDMNISTKAGYRPGLFARNIQEYAIGTKLTKKEVEDEYGKNSQVAVEMKQTSNFGLCVNQTNDWYIILQDGMNFVSYRELKYSENRLYAEIHFKDETTSVVCKSPEIKSVKIPQQKEVVFIKFYSIYADTNYINGKEVVFYSKPVYLDKKYLIGKRIDFNSIDANQISSSTYADLQNVYKEDNNAVFCKTPTGITTLSKNETLVSQSELHLLQNHQK